MFGSHRRPLPETTHLYVLPLVLLKAKTKTKATTPTNINANRQERAVVRRWLLLFSWLTLGHFNWKLHSKNSAVKISTWAFIGFTLVNLLLLCISKEGLLYCHYNSFFAARNPWEKFLLKVLSLSFSVGLKRSLHQIKQRCRKYASEQHWRVQFLQSKAQDIFQCASNDLPCRDFCTLNLWLLGRAADYLG